MAGHADDATPLGPAPKAGKVEHRAAWHAAAAPDSAGAVQAARSTAYVILDGTLISIDRVGIRTGADRPGASYAAYAAAHNAAPP